MNIKTASHVAAIAAHAIRKLTTNPRALLREVKEYIAYQLVTRVANGEIDGVTAETVEEIAPGAFQSPRTKAAILAALEEIHAATDKAVSEYYARRREEIRAKKAAEPETAPESAPMTEAEIRAAVDGFDVPKGVHVFLKNDAYGATQITIRTDSGQMWRKWNYETDFRFELARELAYYATPKAATPATESAPATPEAEQPAAPALTIADDVPPELAEQVRRIARRWTLKPGYRLEVTHDELCAEALIWRGDDIFYSGWSTDDNFIYDLDHAMRKAVRNGAPVSLAKAEPCDEYHEKAPVADAAAPVVSLAKVDPCAVELHRISMKTGDRLQVTKGGKPAGVIRCSTGYSPRLFAAVLDGHEYRANTEEAAAAYAVAYLGHDDAGSREAVALGLAAASNTEFADPMIGAFVCPEGEIYGFTYDELYSLQARPENEREAAARDGLSAERWEEIGPHHCPEATPEAVAASIGESTVKVILEPAPVDPSAPVKLRRVGWGEYRLDIMRGPRPIGGITCHGGGVDREFRLTVGDYVRSFPTEEKAIARAQNFIRRCKH